MKRLDHYEWTILSPQCELISSGCKKYLQIFDPCPDAFVSQTLQSDTCSKKPYKSGFVPLCHIIKQWKEYYSGSKGPNSVIIGAQNGRPKIGAFRLSKPKWNECGLNFRVRPDSFFNLSKFVELWENGKLRFVVIKIDAPFNVIDEYSDSSDSYSKRYRSKKHYNYDESGEYNTGSQPDYTYSKKSRSSRNYSYENGEYNADSQPEYNYSRKSSGNYSYENGGYNQTNCSTDQYFEADQEYIDYQQTEDGWNEKEYKSSKKKKSSGKYSEDSDLEYLYPSESKKKTNSKK